jgi:hypothetical protein
MSVRNLRGRFDRILFVDMRYISVLYGKFDLIGDFHPSTFL